MAHSLPDLPYSSDALAPHISAETLSFHHGKHHAGYVGKLNAALGDLPQLANLSLEELVARGPSTGVFNNAAQHYNHSFYWQSLSPNGGGRATGSLGDAIDDTWGSFEAFQEAFTKEAATHFGSGWGWLVKDSNGNLSVMSTHDAGCPLTEGLTPLITVDVWEHAYYIDYRNLRPKFVETFLDKLVNWKFAEQNFA